MVDTKLDSYMSGYTDFNDWSIRKRYECLRQYFHGSHCLEMGSAEGTGTPYLLEFFEHVTVVDGSKDAVKAVTEKYKSNKLTAVQAYFEDMDFGDQLFDTIVLAHILEHVDTPQTTLAQAKKFLKPDGILIIDVPNGNSLHRQIGVKMGLLGKKTDLNDADLSIGHQRVYTPETFREEMAKAGLEIVEFGGMFIKVLSNAQTEKVLNEQQLNAFFDVGFDNPEIAAEMFVIARLKQGK